ncbi:RING/U-box superfamily protein [Wolffia australiana]
MASSVGESSSWSQQNPSCSGASNPDAGDFECNICFELAQDPIITLCGHLFCWPCLYKWLHVHARAPECPVCKAMVQEDKLVPLYGRGKSSSDPRSKSIPHRPAGQRPDTAPQPDPHQHFPHHGFGFTGGYPPVATARIGNFSLTAGFGGLFPSLFNFHVQGFPDPSTYGHSTSFPYGFGNSFHGGGHAHGFPPRTAVRQQDNSLLTGLFLVVGAFVLFALLFT